MTQTIKTARPSRISKTFRALRHRNYQLWFFGQGISLIGTWMQTMAQQVLVYDLTGSAAALGVVSLIGLIPLIPLSFLGGSISDRFPKRNVLLITQSVMLIEALILAVLCWTDVIEVWHVYVLSFILGCANAVDLPARQAFTVDMVEGKEDLTNAIGLNSAMFNGARAIGPAMAGLIVAITGVGTAFFINGLSFVAVMISLLLMRNLPKPLVKENEETNTLKHMGEGVRFMVSQNAVKVLMSLIAVSAFLSMPYNTLMPVFAEKTLAESAQPVINAICGSSNQVLSCESPEALPLGILLTSVGTGALIGALIIASLSETAHRGKLLTIGNLLFPAALVVFSLSQSFILSVIIMLVVGFSFVWQNALANTLLQLIVPDELRGRVMGFYTMTFQGMMRLGGMQAGLMGDWLGAPFAVGIGALISLIFGGFVAVRYPVIRKL